jgi:hypothetical protein
MHYIKIALASIALFFTTFALVNAQAGSFWIPGSSYLKPVKSTWGLQIPSLGSSGNPCTTVDANGKFSTTTCSSLSGGTTNLMTYWTGAGTIGATSSPTVGYVTATSTTATSTFPRLASSILAWLQDLYVAGTAWFAGNVNVTGNLAVTGTSTLATTTTSMLNGVIVVDGVSYPKTGAGIQRAIDVCHAISCGGVHLTAGTYVVSSPISVATSTILYGDDRDKTVLLLDKDNLANFGFSYILRPYGTAPYVTIRNLTLNGDYDNLVAPAENRGGLLAPANHWTVENVVFDSTNYFSFFPNGDSHVTLRNSIFRGNNRGNDCIGGGSSDYGLYENNVFEEGIDCNAFDQVLGSNVTLRGNVVEQPGADFYLEGMTNSVVENNTLFGATDIAVSSDRGYASKTFITNPSNVIVKQNYLKGGGSISLVFSDEVGHANATASSPGGGNVISSNVIEGPRAYGIMMTARVNSNDIGGNIISNNVVIGANQSNQATSNTGSGVANPSAINVLRGSGVVIEGNSILATTTALQHYGIQVGQTFSPSDINQIDNVIVRNNSCLPQYTVSGCFNLVSPTYTTNIIYADGPTETIFATSTSPLLSLRTSGTDHATSVLSIINTGSGDTFIAQDQANDTTPFVIDTSGNVGIGSSTPSRNLTVRGSLGMVVENTTGSLGARFRTGSANDLEWTGDAVLSTWSGTGFSGTQYNQIRFYSNGDPMLFTRGIVLNNSNSTGSAFSNVFLGRNNTGFQNAFVARVKDNTTDLAADYANTANNTALTFSTRPSGGSLTEQMKITHLGNVGIGTTSPYAKLSVVGDVVASFFTATGTSASTFPYASSTAISATTFYGALAGNALTATALGANGANCGAGQAPLGVDASGAVESCFDVWTEAENTSAGYITSSALTPYFALADWYATTSAPQLTSLANLTITASQVSDFSAAFDARLGATSSLPQIGSLTGLGNIGSSSATTTVAGHLKVDGNITTPSSLKGGALNVTGGSGTISLYADTDVSEYNLGVTTSGTLSLFGSAAESLNLNLADGNLTVGGAATSTFAGGLTVGGAAGLTVLQSGYVGIGRDNPGMPLSMYTTGSGTASAVGMLTIGWDDPASLSYNQLQGMGTKISFYGASGDNNGASAEVSSIGTYKENGSDGSQVTSLFFGTNAGSGNTEKIRITGAGNVGIGTTSPYAKLSVVGSVVAQNFTATSGTSTFQGIQATAVYDDGVLLTDWLFDLYYDGHTPEPVEEGYQLLNINETRRFAETNRHLPTIDGREEWEKTGRFSIGKLVTQLWETVETQATHIWELSDWVASHDTRIEALEAENKALKERLERLEAQL